MHMPICMSTVHTRARARTHTHTHKHTHTHRYLLAEYPNFYPRITVQPDNTGKSKVRRVSPAGVMTRGGTQQERLECIAPGIVRQEVLHPKLRSPTSLVQVCLCGCLCAISLYPIHALSAQTHAQLPTTGDILIADTGNQCIRALRADMTFLGTFAGEPGTMPSNTRACVHTHMDSCTHVLMRVYPHTCTHVPTHKKRPQINAQPRMHTYRRQRMFRRTQVVVIVIKR